MSPIRSSTGVVAGQLDPTQLAGYEELASATVGFVVAAVVVYLVGRLLLVLGMMRLIDAWNRNNPTLQSAMKTYAHAIVIGALTSGLFLITDPDFNVDDWISQPGGEGVVEAVDFRVTRVRAANDETISVPSMELTTSVFTRLYDRKRYRLTEHVNIVHADDVELTLCELTEAAWEDDHILDSSEPTVCIVESTGGPVGLQTESWVGPPIDVNLVNVRSQYRRRVRRRFDEKGLALGLASGREVSGRLDVDPVGERDNE